MDVSVVCRGILDILNRGVPGDTADWYNLWKSRGGSVVYLVPREVPKVIRLSDYPRNLLRDKIHPTTPKAFPPELSPAPEFRETSRIWEISGNSTEIAQK